MTNEATLDARQAFIAAMRRVAASVTVVTTDGAAGCFGATVSAFTSVSADPPMVLVCLHEESRIARAVTANRCFCVNVLPETASEIADRFAGRHDDRIGDRFTGIGCSQDVPQGPVIDEATTFACELEQVMRSGSHLIVVGRVRTVLDGQSPPLTYRDGTYHRVIPQDFAPRSIQ